MEFVSPWSDISRDWLYDLNHLPGLPENVLDAFYGEKKTFSTEDFAKEDFLISHCCKGLILLCSLLCVILFFLTFVLFLLVQWLGNLCEFC